MAWSQLTRRPLQEHRIPVENVIKQETETGVVLRRKRFTGNKWIFEITFDKMLSANATVLINLWNACGMHTSFAFTDKTGVARTVYFNEVVQWNEVGGIYTFNKITLREE